MKQTTSTTPRLRARAYRLNTKWYQQTPQAKEKQNRAIKH